MWRKTHHIAVSQTQPSSNSFMNFSKVAKLLVGFSFWQHRWANVNTWPRLRLWPVFEDVINQQLAGPRVRIPHDWVHIKFTQVRGILEFSQTTFTFGVRREMKECNIFFKQMSLNSPVSLTLLVKCMRLKDSTRIIPKLSSWMEI